MKDKDKSYKKGKESTIGKIIYGFLLFMPLIAISVTCAYAIFNKNAYQSYSGTNENTESNIKVNTINNFDYSKTYYITNSIQTGTPPNNSSAYMYFDNVQVVKNNSTTQNEVIEQFDRMYIYSTGATLFYNFYYNQTNITFNSSTDFLLKIKIRSFNGNNSALEQLNYNLSNSSSLYYIEYYTNQQLDNVFYYSVDKVTESPLFNWVENNAIYTGILNTCEILSITNTFIPLLLTYWLIISVIYFLYDIILMILHILHRKIHELQDTI